MSTTAMRRENSRMPVVFFGHGSPMNTLERNQYTESWRWLGSSIPKPKAILCISAHWYTEGTAVTAMEKPKTIHDFYGFPQALFDVQYPAPGDPKLASRLRELLAPVDVEMDESWGLDHGTWSVLKHSYPGAEIPVVQLSIDGTQPPQFHYETGRRLAPLRDEGVLVAGSGNVVHNLRLMKRAGALQREDSRSARLPRSPGAGRFREARRGRSPVGAYARTLSAAPLRCGTARRGRTDVFRRGRLRLGLGQHAYNGRRDACRIRDGLWAPCSARRAARA